MVVYGAWQDQDTLVGSTTLTSDADSHDWSGGDGNFTVAVGHTSSHHGARDNLAAVTAAVAWDVMRGADLTSPAHSRSGGASTDWTAGFHLVNQGPFGWDSNLQSVSLLVDLTAFDDYQSLVWPAGVIGVDLEGDGAQHWDLRIEAVPTLDTENRTGATGDFTLVTNSPGTIRVANADIETTTTFPQEVLAATPSGTVLEYLDVPQFTWSFLGTRVLPLADMLADSGPPDVSTPAFVDQPIFHQFHNTYALDVDATVRRPRWRWVYESVVAPPCRIFPREDGLGSGSGRIFPPPRSQQFSNRVGGGSYY